MLGCKIKRDKLMLADSSRQKYDVNGVIGLSGRAQGSVIVCLSETVALRAAAAMLMMDVNDFDGLDNDVVDAVGEVANMVAGSAKAELEEFQLSISLPNVVLGHPADIRFPSEVKPIAVTFQCPWGDMALQVGFTPLPVAAK